MTLDSEKQRVILTQALNMMVPQVVVNADDQCTNDFRVIRSIWEAVQQAGLNTDKEPGAEEKDI